MKGIFVIIEGIADESCQVLGQATPLQFARTPNLDVLAKKSTIDYCYPIKEGVAPETSSTIVSLFGYDPNFVSRGPLEAKGAGIKLTKGDLALTCNFATIDSLNVEEGNILDPRAGRTLTNKEARILAKEINEKVKLPFKFEFLPTMQHRGVVVFRGGFSDNITNADPFYRNGFAYAGVTPKIVFSKAMDDEDDSKLTANLVNTFIRKSHEILDKHPLNINRAGKGLFSANYFLCRGAGNQPAHFKKQKGNWMALCYTPLKKGIAEACKMQVYDFSYPKMKGIDAYDNLYAGLKKAIKSSIKMLKKHGKTYDYFYIHFKETDIPGLDNKPFAKRTILERVAS